MLLKLRRPCQQHRLNRQGLHRRRASLLQPPRPLAPRPARHPKAALPRLRLSPMLSPLQLRELVTSSCLHTCFATLTGSWQFMRWRQMLRTRMVYRITISTTFSVTRSSTPHTMPCSQCSLASAHSSLDDPHSLVAGSTLATGVATIIRDGHTCTSPSRKLSAFRSSACQCLELIHVALMVRNLWAPRAQFYADLFQEIPMKSFAIVGCSSAHSSHSTESV